MISGSDDATIRIWDVDLGVQLASMTMPAPVRAMAVHDDHVGVGYGDDVAIFRITGVEETE